MIKLSTSVTLLAEKLYEGMKIWLLNLKVRSRAESAQMQFVDKIKVVTTYLGCL